MVPWSAEGQQIEDPRPYAAKVRDTGTVSPPLKQLIPLPPFAFVRPKEEKPTTSGCSWSQTPLVDLQDDALSRGEAPAALCVAWCRFGVPASRAGVRNLHSSLSTVQSRLEESSFRSCFNHKAHSGARIFCDCGEIEPSRFLKLPCA